MEQKPEVKYLQENLALLRKSIGWTAEKLGSVIGVSRQSIANFESNPPRSELTQVHYMAIRVAFNQEIEEKPEETRILQQLLVVCVDEHDKFDDKTRELILNQAKTLAPAIASKDITKKFAGIQWDNVCMAAVSATIGFAAGYFLGVKYDSSAWIKKLKG